MDAKLGALFGPGPGWENDRAWNDGRGLVASLIGAAQEFVREAMGDRSSTSLRDVARCVDLVIWLHDSPFFMARAKKKQAKKEQSVRDKKSGRAAAKAQAKRQWTCECGRVNAGNATRCMICRRARPKSEADMVPLHPLAGALLLSLSSCSPSAKPAECRFGCTRCTRGWCTSVGLDQKLRKCWVY